MSNNNFQREGAKSNAHVGRQFEKEAQLFLEKCLGVSEFENNMKIYIGFESKKEHAFDFGGRLTNGYEFVLESKSHTWTKGKNVPSAKLTVWNEAMLYFSLLQPETVKFLFVLKDINSKTQESLASYYIRNFKHLIPENVQIIEHDFEFGLSECLFKS